MRERELDPGASPAAFFGNEVREARTKAKMSQPALGAAVGYDGTYVSKVETGTIVPDDDFVNGLDRVFPHMNGWFARFWNNSRKWEGQYPAWFKDWVDAEEHARVIRWWEPLLIPGLLQTADYARELFRAWQISRRRRRGRTERFRAAGQASHLRSAQSPDSIGRDRRNGIVARHRQPGNHASTDWSTSST